VVAKIVLGALLGVGISVVWFVSPSLHLVEIENATSSPLRGVALRLARDDEVEIGDLAPGATITRRTWHTSRSSGPITITSLQGGRREVLGSCGYVALGPSKDRVRIGGSASEGADCKSEMRLVGWPW
jgi:hypothetical protein